jgi:hypothetical protein
VIVHVIRLYRDNLVCQILAGQIPRADLVRMGGVEPPETVFIRVSHKRKLPLI